MLCPTVEETLRDQTHNPWAEKRAEPRYKCPKLLRMRPVTVPESSFRLSLVQNVSASGIGLLLTYGLSPGTLIEIEMPGRTATKRFARVMHATKQEGGWLIGCALNHSLSNGELERMLT
jgi:hypothetical protein